MILLAVDTATPLVSVALWRDGAVVAASAEAAERRHGERLAPVIETVLDEAGVLVADLEVMAVDVGPGLFTGLRVGVAFVKGLAAARSLPVVAVTSLEALAWPWRDDPRLLLAAVDARRGEVFAELTAPAGGGPRRPCGPAAPVAPADLPALVALRPEPPEHDERPEHHEQRPEQPEQRPERPAGVLAVGDGARRYADALGGVELGPSAADHPVAAGWADLAAERAQAGQVVTAAELAAVYLRGADVRIGWAQRATPQRERTP